MGSRRKVLVVDDYSVAADSVVKLLQLMGHEASAVYSGRSALDVAPLLKPDVIFVDLMMPEMDGLQLARRLKALPDMKAQLIALTAYSKSKIADETGEVGFDGFIPKPATADALEWTLSHAGLVK